MLAISVGMAAALLAVRSAEQGQPGPYEYVTIRWAGKDNTHLIRPGGKAEIIGDQLRKIPRPEHVDDRAFYMNIAMNGLVKEGYEFAGMTDDQIIMRRHLAQ